jgi:predicted ATPase
MSQIVIVSGPPGAGKSTVCDSLCERYDRTVHLETDDAYAWIRMGFIQPWKPGSAPQNMMVSRACARAAVAFAREHYGVFIDGVISPLHLAAYIEELAEAAVPVHYAVILPSVATIIQRSNEREKIIAGANNDMFVRTHAMFANAAPPPGFTIDNDGMTADQTADRIMNACGRGEALVWTP